MEELIIGILKGYGLPGLVVAMVGAYFWKVKIPADAAAAQAVQASTAKRDAFIEDLVTTGNKRSEALLTAFREDLEKKDDKFVAALGRVEAEHSAQLTKVIDDRRDAA